MTRSSACLLFLGKASLCGGLYLALGLGWTLVVVGVLAIAAGVLLLDKAPRQ